MLPILILGAVTVGIVCGRFYSFMAVILTSPLLALVGGVSANRMGWGLGRVIATGAVAMVVSQAAFLVGARLRVGRARWGKERAHRAVDAGKRGQALPSKTTTI